MIAAHVTLDSLLQSLSMECFYEGIDAFYESSLYVCTAWDFVQGVIAAHLESN
jgi:hypothetical protein